MSSRRSCKSLGKWSAAWCVAALVLLPAARPADRRQAEELLVTTSEPGTHGGRLVTALRSEPKTLNPVFGVDISSKGVIAALNADLIHINRETQRTVPALAKSWRVSRDGRTYRLELRRGLRFSDGHPLDADDVLFSFQVYLDERVQSPQRDLLVVAGKPLAVRKLDADTLEFQLAQPYAAAERLFDSVSILPRHLLERAYQEGKLTQAWSLNTPPAHIAGTGPFRLKEYVPGERLVLERNPYYWKMDRQGHRLPYLDELVFLFVPNEDAQTIRFQAGDTDVITRLSAQNFAALEKDQPSRGYHLSDLGPGLEYNFLFFNLNVVATRELQGIARKQSWFREVKFRQAVSAAIDREGIMRLVYQGRATPLWGHVTPGNKLWADRSLPQPPRSLDRARQLLSEAGFHWGRGGSLLDENGEPVEFSIAVSTSNPQRVEMATLIQNDLSQLGMKVHVAELEFHSLLDRIFHTYDYEACVLGLGSGDADPTAEMNVWLSNGSTHLWHLGEKQPATPWEQGMDRLMEEQLTTLDYAKRKRLYDEVQRLEEENLPLICLASPDILVGAKQNLGNFLPAILEPYALWNVDELFFRPGGSANSP